MTFSKVLNYLENADGYNDEEFTETEENDGNEVKYNEAEEDDDMEYNEEY